LVEKSEFFIAHLYLTRRKSTTLTHLKTIMTDLPEGEKVLWYEQHYIGVRQRDGWTEFVYQYRASVCGSA